MAAAVGATGAAATTAHAQDPTDPGVALSPSTDDRNVVQPTAGGVVPFTVRGHAAQSDDLLRIEASGGDPVLRVLSARESNQGAGIELRQVATDDSPWFTLRGLNGAMAIGLDVAADVPYRDLFIGKWDSRGLGPTSFQDVLYVNHNGRASSATVDFFGHGSSTTTAVTIAPPNPLDAPEWETLVVRKLTDQTGKAFAVRAGFGAHDYFAVTDDGRIEVRDAAGGNALRQVIDCATGQQTAVGAAHATPMFSTRVTGDTHSRFAVTAAGVMSFGPGNAPCDATISRNAPGSLFTANTGITAIRTTPSTAALATRVTGESNDRLRLRADGVIFFGDGAGKLDCRIDRQAADRLRIDAAVAVGTTSYGGAGKGVVVLGDAGSVPTANVSGGQLYAEGGALKWRGSSGTVTTLAPA